MKKLMIIAAAVFAAIASNAATVKWSSSGLIGLDGSKAGADYSILVTVVSDTTDTFKSGSEFGPVSYKSGMVATQTAGDTGSNLGTIVFSATAYGPAGATLDLGSVTQAIEDAGSTYTLKFVANNSKDDWAAAPEPTSGMLLLIGVAGLALRRRRA